MKEMIKFYLGAIIACTIITMWCIASHLETVNGVREFPNKQEQEDDRQLAEMQKYHNNPNLNFFE